MKGNTYVDYVDLKTRIKFNEFLGNTYADYVELKAWIKFNEFLIADVLNLTPIMAKGLQ